MRSAMIRRAALVLLLVPSVARAQSAPSIDVRTWRASPDPNASLVIEPVSVAPSGAWSVGVWGTYAYRPITLRTASGDAAFAPIEHQLAGELVASVGVFQRAMIGLSAALIAYQTGTVPPPLSAPPSTAFGDTSVWGKATIVDNDQGSGIVEGFGLAAVANIGLPTGARSSFAGEGAVTASARLIAEYTYIVATIQASLGYAMRFEGRAWPDGDPAAARFGDEIPWHFGVRLRPKVFLQSIDSDDRQQWEIAAHGWLPADPVAPFGLGSPGATALSPVLLALSDRFALGHRHDFGLTAGVDIGLTHAVGTPAVRGILGFEWAPRKHDEDNDGVDDDADQCPGLAEDRDGIDDSDGCPEDDADDDNVPDAVDACPKQAGAPSDDPKRNGCP